VVDLCQYKPTSPVSGPTMANMTGIGDFLKRIAGSIATRRARGAGTAVVR